MVRKLLHKIRNLAQLSSIVAMSVVATQANGQTTVIDPAGDGGFNLGPTMADNGWTAVNGSATNAWNVGSAPSLFTNNPSAYISNDGGVTHAYSISPQANSSLVHFYKDVTFPAGETAISLSFNWYGGGEGTTAPNFYDFLQVSLMPTSVTPVEATNFTGPIASMTTPLISGATVLFGGNLKTSPVQTVTITIPASVAGNTSSASTMRLAFTWRNDQSVGTNPPAAVDNISLMTFAACSGTPTAGTASSNVASICANTSFTLSLTGTTFGSGISVQWESSPAGAATFSPIAGATDPTYTVTGFSAATDYHAVVTCSSGGGMATSNDVTVNLTPANLCNYCVANLGGATGNTITNVEIVGTTLSNSSGASTLANGSYLTSFPATGSSTATLVQGTQYTLNTTFSAASIASVWIDYDQDGTYAAGEWTQLTTNAASASISFTVPVNALTGQTGMRLRTRGTGNTNGAANACTNFGTGETEDYIITIIAPTNCSGMPSAGTVSGPATICPNTNFTLSSTGFTIGTGISYQWESSPGGANTWSPIAGATNPTYAVTGGISSATDYQLTVTCSFGGNSATSNMVAVAVNPFYNCYCTPVSNCTNEGIENVNMGTINNSSTYCTNTSGYTDYSSLGSLTNLIQAQVVPISVTAHINSSPASAAVWIDYNHSGTFDASEFTSLGSVTGAPTPSTYVYTGNVIIDPNALTGVTRMRVRQANQNGITDASSCITTNAYGEFEDYLVTIIAGNLCTGTPTAGTVNAPASVCGTVPFTLTTSGTTNSVTGLTYQWESTPAGAGTWVPIAGATNPTYTETTGISAATDYRMSITCTNGGGVDVTAPVSVAMTAATQCYCTPSGSSTNYGVNNFSTTGGSTNISNLGTGTSPNGYANYTSQVLTASASDVISFNASYVGTGTYGFAIYIDYNQNGSFADAGETVFNTTAYATSAAGSFTIPSSAMSGSTRIRIVANFLSTTPVNQYCSTGISGEFEDYTLNIGAPPSCLAPAMSPATNLTTTSADINWNASPSNPANGYDYYYSTSNVAPTAATLPSGSVGAGVLTASLSGLAPSTVQYVWVRSNCGGGDYSSWAASSFQTLIGNDLPAGGTLLTVGAACSGAPYTNVGGSLTSGEPTVSCRGASLANGHLVWFKFVAPTSGFVKVTTDVSGGGLTDTKLGLFGTTNSSDPTDLASYYIIGCDDDNGVTVNFSSTVYASGLTAGETYYVGVDHYDGTATGTFCLQVDEVTTAMLAPSGSCVATTNTTSLREDYSGWATVVDAQGRLIANAQRVTPGATNTVYAYSASVTVNTSGSVRQAGTQYYLDRNFLMGYGSTGTAFNVKFYFLNSEFDAFNLASGGTVSLSDLNVTHQTGTTCVANYNSTPGINTLLTQTGSGSGNGVSWVTVNTPGFSNFYIMTGANPLSISLTNISAVNAGNRNRVDWTTATEQAGDKFEVERSVDGVNFTRIGIVSAKGSASSYSYWDNAPVSGANHYRLNLLEASGKNAYSKVVTAIVKNGAFNVLAYPNPATDVLKVQAYGTEETLATITVLDMTGKLIRQLEMRDGKAEVNLNGIAPGVYQLKYTDNRHSQSLKISKQ